MQSHTVMVLLQLPVTLISLVFQIVQYLGFTLLKYIKTINEQYIHPNK